MFALMLFSILIATYRRADLIMRSVHSALRFCADSGVQAEVIVIDDASGDGTPELLRQNFADELASGQLKLVELPQNVGVTAARMAGFEVSQGHWLVVFDSDDQFVPDRLAAQQFAELLRGHENPIIFTRCISFQTGHVIGPAAPDVRQLDIAEFVSRGTPGECMPAHRRDVLETIPYDAAIRAFEGLTMARQIATFGAALVSPLAVRIYNDTKMPDRLCSFSQRRRRARDLMQGFQAMLREFGPVMTPRARHMNYLRYLMYRLLAFT